MSHPTGPTKEAFLRKVKALVLAAYDDGFGANREFIIRFTSNSEGEVSAVYHECETADADDNVPLTKLGSDSVWQKVAAPEKDYEFMARHNAGVARARTEEQLMAVIDDTIMNFPGDDDLIYRPDGDMLNIKQKRSMESVRSECKRLKVVAEDEVAFERAVKKAHELGVKKPVKCQFLAKCKEERVIIAEVKAKEEVVTDASLAKMVAPGRNIARVKLTCPARIRMLEKMRKEQNNVDVCLTSKGVEYKFLRGTWDGMYRIDPNFVVTSDRGTFKIGGNPNAHYQRLADKRGGMYLGPPHKGQVSIGKVYNTLFPQTAVKRVSAGGKKGKLVVRLPTPKASHKAEVKLAKSAKKILKNDGAPPKKPIDYTKDALNVSARAEMMARMTSQPKDVLGEALKSTKAKGKKAKGKK